MPFYTILPERRQHPRIDCDFRALIRYMDRGIPEERVATLLNLSACGCFLALDQPLPEHTKVFILTHVSNERRPTIRGPRLALRGIVARIASNDERPGVGVKLTSHRFLPPASQRISDKGQSSLSA
jgi:hypothetical protein